MHSLKLSVVALVFTTLISGCKIGNDLGGSCARGETCVCDLIGNCTRSCPQGGCHYVCRGQSNCIFDCAGGGCDTLCENTGNCISMCGSSDCTISCKGNGTCVLNGTRDMTVIDLNMSMPKDLSATPPDLSKVD